MQNCFLYFKSEILETIGGAQQMCFQPFFQPLGKLIDLPIVALGTIGDAVKSPPSRKSRAIPTYFWNFWIAIVRSSLLLLGLQLCPMEKLIQMEPRGSISTVDFDEATHLEKEGIIENRILEYVAYPPLEIINFQMHLNREGWRNRLQSNSIRLFISFLINSNIDFYEKDPPIASLTRSPNIVDFLLVKYREHDRLSKVHTRHIEVIKGWNVQNYFC